MRRGLRYVPLFAALAIPLGSPEPWLHLKYSNKPQNQVSFGSEGLGIQVTKSASPLLYKLAQPREVTAITAEGYVSAFPDLEPRDYALRLGLVTEGSRTLNWFQKLFASEWVKQLVELAPGKGFGKIHFYVLSQGKEVGERRILSEGDAMEETIAASQTQPGDFTLAYAVTPPSTVSAVWLQSDGDDSQTTFAVKLRKLTLTTPD